MKKRQGSQGKSNPTLTVEVFIFVVLCLMSGCIFQLILLGILIWLVGKFIKSCSIDSINIFKLFESNGERQGFKKDEDISESNCPLALIIIAGKALRKAGTIVQFNEQIGLHVKEGITWSYFTMEVKATYEYLRKYQTLKYDSKNDISIYEIGRALEPKEVKAFMDFYKHVWLKPNRIEELGL